MSVFSSGRLRRAEGGGGEMVGFAAVVLLSSGKLYLSLEKGDYCICVMKLHLGMFKIIGKMHFPLTSLGAAFTFLQADGMMYIKLSLMSGGLF